MCLVGSLTIAASVGDFEVPVPCLFSSLSPCSVTVKEIRALGIIKLYWLRNEVTDEVSYFLVFQTGELDPSKWPIWLIHPVASGNLEKRERTRLSIADLCLSHPLPDEAYGTPSIIEHRWPQDSKRKEVEPLSCFMVVLALIINIAPWDSHRAHGSKWKGTEVPLFMGQARNVGKEVFPYKHLLCTFPYPFKHKVTVYFPHQINCES